MIKVAQVDEAMYNFWDDYKNIMELGINPFFRYSSSIRSNISGGLGYWQDMAQRNIFASRTITRIPKN